MNLLDLFFLAVDFLKTFKNALILFHKSQKKKMQVHKGESILQIYIVEFTRCPLFFLRNNYQ